MDPGKQELIARQLTLYRSLFRGREDVYAYRWQAQGGRSGYSPAREKKDGPFVPLSDRVRAAHLAGKTTVGIYPLLSDGTTWLLAVDFDGKQGDPLADAQRLIAYCKDWGIPAYLERSRSGAGYHVWMFFSAPVPAWKARLVALRVLLPEAGVQMNEKAAYDRLFPNQDRHSGKGLGNLIALPLQGERLKHGRTAFLDVSNGLNPYPSQWAFLETIQRTDEAKLDEIMAEFGLSEQDAPQTGREAAPGPEEVQRRMAGGFAEGEGRNEAAFTVARRLAAKGMPQEEAQAFMVAWNQSNRPPLDPGELQRTVESAYQREAEGAGKNGKHQPSPHVHDGDGEGCPVTFSPIPFSRLLKEAPEVHWLVSGLIPTGTAGVLAADPGAGKSWLLADLAIAVATGTPWLNKFETRQGSVLIIDEENALALIRRRGLKLLRGRGLPETGDLPIEYLVSSGLNLSDPRHVGGLDALLKDRRPALGLVDSLVRVHRGNENSSTDMAAVFAEIKRLMDNYGTSFIFSHHSRKLSAFNDAGQMLRGSSEIKAFCDCYFFLRKVGDVLRMEHGKARYSEPVPNFIVSIEDPPDVPEATRVLYVSEAQVDPQDRQQEAEAFILDVLAEGRLRRKEIVARGKDAKLSERTIDRAIKALEETGQVERSKDGREATYTLKTTFATSAKHVHGEGCSGEGSKGIEDAVFEEVKL